jgi:propanol-preferring alcohol dehydrogenase
MTEGPIPELMRAMVLERPRTRLELREIAVPQPGPGHVLLRVLACGVCRTDRHVIDGDLPDPKLPLVLGHQIVGKVVAAGAGVGPLLGTRVGVPWLGHTDGTCRFCRTDRENLCLHPEFTGYTVDGGFAEFAVAAAEFCFPVPDVYDDVHAAPLLCAGLIGYRTYRKCGPHANRLGIYGFGAAAHIICQIAVHEGKTVYAFTKPGDTVAQDFARNLGATWAGGSNETPPERLDAAMVFAPAGPLMVEALRCVDRGGTVVSGGIHMSDIPAFPYEDLWEERTLTSVANLTRDDGTGLLEIAPRVPVHTEAESYPLQDANRAIDDLTAGRVRGAAVLVP